MASAFSHAIAAVAIGRGLSLRESLKFWVLGICCSVIPDADVVAFWLGIPYEHPFGHRGLTHSFFFAALLALVVMVLFYRDIRFSSKKFFRLFGYFFLATASHAILDAFTNGGRGVAFFYPFTSERYFFPWRPIQVSPISIGSFFSDWGIRVLKSEFIWVWIPSLIVIGISYLYPARKQKE